MKQENVEPVEEAVVGVSQKTSFRDFGKQEAEDCLLHSIDLNDAPVPLRGRTRRLANTWTSRRAKQPGRPANIWTRKRKERIKRLSKSKLRRKAECRSIAYREFNRDELVLLRGSKEIVGYLGEAFALPTFMLCGLFLFPPRFCSALPFFLNQMSLCSWNYRLVWPRSFFQPLSGLCLTKCFSTGVLWIQWPLIWLLGP